MNTDLKAEWELNREYARADTGDDFDDAYDAIIAIEEVDLIDGKVKIDDCVMEYMKKGANVRAAGALCHKGEAVIRKGMKITPTLASVLVIGGARRVEVYKKPVLVYIPTGDELIGPGEVPHRGETLESNSMMVRGMAEEMGAEVVCLPIIRDDKEALEEALDEAMSYGDIILINGGSSKGSEDFNSELIRRKASVFRHGIKAVPGRPVGISIIDDKPVINMPGPAFATFIALDWCVRGLIAHYYGTKPEKRMVIKAKLTKDLFKKQGFEMYYQFDVKKENGEYFAYPVSRASSLPYTMLNTKALCIAPLEAEGYKCGDEIELEMMCGPQDLQ